MKQTLRTPGRACSRERKREEGGHKEMCKLTDEIYQEGRTEGITQKAVHTAEIMHSKGFDNAEIAEILEVSTETVQVWLSLGSSYGSN